MRRGRLRFLIPFGLGVAVAASVVTVSGGVGSLAATRYEDLNLFTSVRPARCARASRSWRQLGRSGIRVA